MSQEILIAGSTKRLALSSGQAIRMPVYGHNWTKIRIGLRVSFPTTGSITGTPQLVLGMCAGTAGYADALTTNFVGVRSTATLWNMTGTPGSNAVLGSLSWKACTRVGSTLTDASGTLGGATLNYLSGEALIRNAFILQIEKGSPNYTIRLCMPIASTTGQIDVSDTQLIQFMEQDDSMTSPNSIIANYQTLATNNTIAASETPGDLDHICVFWDKSSVKCYIDDVNHKLVTP